MFPKYEVSTCKLMYGWSKLREVKESQFLPMYFPAGIDFAGARPTEPGRLGVAGSFEVLNFPESMFSSVAMNKGFSKALSICIIFGRFRGLGLRQDLATTAIAHTSIKRSSSMIKDGSTTFTRRSLSCREM